MTIEYHEIIARLYAYRMSLRLTQQKMAPLLGIAQSQYSKIESGESIITYQSLVQMYANHLEVDYLITGIHSPKSILNTLVEKCPETKRAKFLHLIAWSMEIELAHSKVSTEDFKPQIYYQLEVTRQCLNTKRNIWNAIRDVNQISQAEMAKGLCISLNRYRKIEKAAAFPDAEILMHMYNFIKYPPSMFLSVGHECIENLNSFWACLDTASQKEAEIFLKNGLEYIQNR